MSGWVLPERSTPCEGQCLVGFYLREVPLTRGHVWLAPQVVEVSAVVHGLAKLLVHLLVGARYEEMSNMRLY